MIGLVRLRGIGVWWEGEPHEFICKMLSNRKKKKRTSGGRTEKGRGARNAHGQGLKHQTDIAGKVTSK